MRKKFQDDKLYLVDETVELDKQNRQAIQRADYLRSQRNSLSKEIGGLLAKGEKEKAAQIREEVKSMQDELAEIEQHEKELAEQIKDRMLRIPQIIDPSVPLGKDDSENVEVERFGDNIVPDYKVPYHIDIMESFNGIDLDSAEKQAARFLLS